MNTPLNSLNQLIEWLESHINYERTGPGDRSTNQHDPLNRLQCMGALVENLGDPHQLYPSIHLTGTNGKTSTARMITELMIAQGLRVGSFTSPHLQRMNERIALNGQPLEDHDLFEVLLAIALTEPLLGEDKPTYFEILTAGAFRYFADSAVDVGVIEVGVGGLWDATNVIEAPVAVVTNVELDHQNYLGNTRHEIAEQKAGIVKESSTLILGETDPALYEIFAQRKPARILLADRDFHVEDNRVAVGGRLVNLRTPRSYYEDVFINLHGGYQGTNAALAVVAAEEFFEKPLGEDVIREALENVKSPGRMEVAHRQPLVVLDGAHNLSGAKMLVEGLKDEFSTNPGRVLVVGMLDPHDPAEILNALEVSACRMVVACQVDSPRAVPAHKIAEVASSLGAPAVAITDAGKALAEAMSCATDEDLVLVTGSLYVVGEARSALLGLSTGNPAT